MSLNRRPNLGRAATVAVLAASVVACRHVDGPGHGGGRETAAAEVKRPALAPNLVASAAAYERYMRQAGGLRGDFRSAAAVREALLTGVSYERNQLEEGAIAYAALAALQDQDFVRAVQGLDRGRQADLANRIAVNPAAVLEVRGADRAGALAGGALRAHGAKVLAAGRSVKQAAYDVQHQSWSKAFVSDRPNRLARAKALSATRFRASPEDASRMLQTVAAGDWRGGAPTPVVQRAVALAALAAMGRDGDGRLAAPLLSEPRSADCLKMAKLNLFQCLAVAGPHYEDVFCLGQHALIDTGQCVAEAGGAPKAGRRAALDTPSRSVATPAPIAVAVG
jgi:hypothetical protein